MAEPYPGYYASDPVYNSETCKELYELVGDVADNHYHPLVAQ